MLEVCYRSAGNAAKAAAHNGAAAAAGQPYAAGGMLQNAWQQHQNRFNSTGLFGKRTTSSDNIAKTTTDPWLYLVLLLVNHSCALVKFSNIADTQVLHREDETGR